MMQNWFLSFLISSVEDLRAAWGTVQPGRRWSDVIDLMERERVGKDEKWWGRRMEDERQIYCRWQD
jgi:hypothetical protein